MAERDPLQPASGSRLTVDVDELPRTGVRDFVCRLAEANQIVYERTRLDDWADAVTQAAGDDVKLDATETLLLALAKKQVITGRQLMRLLNNYMEEADTVRPVQPGADASSSSLP
jgi:DNA-binding response OmpR family regulator